MHIGKTGTDVLLIGSAWAPDRTSGARGCRSGCRSPAVRRRSSSPEIACGGTGSRRIRQPFESMPLVWERAFGGVHRSGDKVAAEERNPVGCGFAGGRSAADMQGLPVPNLEDPAAPLATGRPDRQRPRVLRRLRRRGCLAARSPGRTTSAGSAPRAVSAGRFRSAVLPVRGAGVRVRPLSAGGRARAGRRRDCRTGRSPSPCPSSRLERRGHRSPARRTRPPAESRDAVDRARREPRVLHVARGRAVRSEGAQGREDRRRSGGRGHERGDWRDARPVRDRQRHRSGVGRRRAPASRASPIRT